MKTILWLAVNGNNVDIDIRRRSSTCKRNGGVQLMGLIDLLPEYYASCPEVAELQLAFEHWTNALKADKQDLLLQLNVATSTWGLELWEKALGLSTDVSKPLDYRRTRIMSKLRGAGTTTKTMIENVAEAFSNGDVEITEYNDESRFEVKFVGTLGIPPNMSDLIAAIEEIKQAHLAYAFIYTYMTWAMFESYNHDWNTWDAYNLTWDQFETHKE